MALVASAHQASAVAPPSDEFFPHVRGGRVVFGIEAPADAKVYIVGDFNGWDPEATPLEYTSHGTWEVSLPIDPGEYEYKFIVDGRRLLDPSNPDEVSGGDGSVNSRLKVLRNGQVSERSHWPREVRRRNEWTLPTGGRQSLSTSGDLTFNRVDGTTLWIKPTYRSSYDFTPEFTAAFGYGYESERVTIVADFAQPVLPGRLLSLGLHFTDGTGFDNQAEVGRSENTLAAMLFKHDFIDYYDIRAVEPYVRLRLPAHLTLRFAHATEDYASLTTQTQWSFFTAGRDHFRPNPQLYLLGDPQGRGGEGRLQASRAEIVFDTRRGRRIGTVGFYCRGFLESGGGDFDYERWLADGRTYLRLGRPVHLAMRLRGGSRFDGTAIPSQKLFYIGGLGTVRGHEFRSQVGDSELLGNLEYSFLSDNLNAGVLLFYDAGTAWDSSRETLDRATLLQAVGFGFKSADGDFQIQFAKPIGAVKGGFETSVRLSRTF